MRKVWLILPLILTCSLSRAGSSLPLGQFEQMLKTIDTLFMERNRCRGCLTLAKVVRNGDRLDFNFTESLSDYVVRPGDESWLRKQIEDNLPCSLSGCKAGKITSRSIPMSNLSVCAAGESGNPATSRYRVERQRGPQIVDNGMVAPEGLSGRNIALWQSHGYYYNIGAGKWMWQRPCMFQTIEDVYTLGYVIPFLVPMLENAGAAVFLPRERDPGREEIVIDNDPSECTSGRIHGSFTTKRKWQKAGSGFADAKALYGDEDRPFEMGTALKCSTTDNRNRENTASWRGEIPTRGEYAVYVTYPSFPRSCTDARYTIHTLGGDRSVRVNQKMGGRTWVYLGTYEFDKGIRDIVTLSNISQYGGGSIVCADAVRIGGGMGNIRRSAKVDSTVISSVDSAAACNPDTNAHYSISGMPRYAEAARYNMQWNGIPASVWSQNNGENDYRDDLMSRGAWVKYLCGGSSLYPRNAGLGIPIDLSLAFHTDAGTKPDATLVGTLSIYTRICENRSTFANGQSRNTCRELADFVQSQVTDDIRALWDSEWPRRPLWNRSYSESRTTGVPAVLLELLSHQNFEDMKFGLDPAFRFNVCRSCYKAILKYLSMHYGCHYTVQPLPVKAFSADIRPASGKGPVSVLLEWEPAVDSLETTATPTSYLVYKREGNGGWSEGFRVTSNRAVIPIQRGQVYSFKVVACNDGGNSFPSEILCAGVPEKDCECKTVLIVNNFNRISGPDWFDSPEYAGFDNRTDSGVPYIRDISFSGEQFEYHRLLPYVNMEQSGFGASREEYAGRIIGGNTFDYPAVHAKSILDAGFNVQSSSSLAFCNKYGISGKSPADLFAVDLICGKEKRVVTATRSKPRGGVFPKEMQKAIENITFGGCNILISGAYIASDPLYNGNKDFTKNILGYSLRRTHASRTGEVSAINGFRLSFPAAPCAGSYCVESPDAISSYGLGSRILMSYSDSSLPAAVCSDFPSYKVIAFGFPLEIISDAQTRSYIIRKSLDYFKTKSETSLSPTMPK